jgi:hypothetical protein
MINIFGSNYFHFWKVTENNIRIYISFRCIDAGDGEFTLESTAGAVKQSNCCVKRSFFEFVICVGFTEVFTVQGK